jgi:hypothetical protein
LPILTVFVIGSSTMLASADGGVELEVATVEAVHLCMAAAADSLDGCGNLAGRTPEASLARRAIIRYTKARGGLLAACGVSRNVNCMHLIEWHTQAGINAALEKQESYSLSR